MLPSEEAIRAMDGPALTRLAFDFGLGLTDRTNGIKTPSGVLYIAPGEATGDLWEPHADIAQAREVFFDRLEKRGLITNRYAGSGFGRVYAKESARIGWKRDRPYMVETLWGLGEPGNSAEATEALALLRCACLAVAAQQREEANHAPA